MTQSQRQKEQAAKRREAARVKQLAAKVRKDARTAKRKAKRAAKAAPKNRLVAWSLRVRACGKCAVCDATDHLQAHHILPKERYQEFKFKQINGVVLCPTHHKFGRYSAHRNPLWFTLWLQQHRPKQYAWAVEHLGTEVPDAFHGQDAPARSGAGRIPPPGL